MLRRDVAKVKHQRPAGGQRQEVADLRRPARRIARSKPAGQILIFNVSKVASTSPTGAPALGHNRLFAKGSLLASHLTMYVQSVTNL